MGGNGWDDGARIAVDAAGNLYLTGHFSGTAHFDPDAGTANLTAAGDYDIFISKLDVAGDFLWAKRIGNNNGDYSWDLVLDAMNNVYITGQFFGTVDFNPGAGTSNMTSAGGYDFFICKLDASGSYLWAKSLGGLNPDVSYGGNNFNSAKALSVDALGNIFTIGTFEGTADFDPNAGVSSITSSGFYDVFICKIDNSGNFVWAFNLRSLNFMKSSSRKIWLDLTWIHLLNKRSILAWLLFSSPI